MSIQNIIRGAPLFNDLYDDEIDIVLKECNVLQLSPGEKVFNEGDVGEDIYLILRGKVNIVKGEILIAELQKADLFGEMIIVYEGTRSTSAFAQTHTDLLIVNYQSVMKMYDKNPRAMSIMMLNLARLLAERLKKSNITVRELKTQLFKKEATHY
jgi:CRP-like cAMP-binding protein